MKIFAISDLHLDSTGEKPMDIFGGKWENHQERLFKNIENTVTDDDMILMPGDISWALKLEDAFLDLKKIDKLKGRKFLGKGNHDYWWGTMAKLNKLNLKTIEFVQTNSHIHKGVGIAGTRGWSPIDGENIDENDEKIFKRELGRLKLSLDLLKREKLDRKIVMLHYPPFSFMDGSKNEFVDIMVEHEVDTCIYGHLHDKGHEFAVEGNVSGVEFHLVSCDFLDLQLKEI